MRRITKALSLALLSVAAFSTVNSYAEGQTAIKEYKDARPIFWKKIYAKNGGETLYCGQQLKKNKFNKGVNIEHVYPMSWATKGLKCGTRKKCRNKSDAFNYVEADLHNMYPAKTEINDARGSLGYAIVPGEARKFGECDFELTKNKRLVEPRDSVRGEIARSMLYMAYEYDKLYLTKPQLSLMKLWNEMDPPSKHEQWRNDRIEQIQGNRNPFIDNPSLAEKVKPFQ
jgi:deoxyribonuclease-1